MYDCLDCGVDTAAIDEYYTIHDSLWLQIHPDDQGMLCVGCAESRLGRVLTRDDFPQYPINMGAFNQSARLKDRLGRQP